MLETLDYTIRIGSIPTFLYFDLYLYSAYAAHFVYGKMEWYFSAQTAVLSECDTKYRALIHIVFSNSFAFMLDIDFLSLMTLMTWNSNRRNKLQKWQFINCMRRLQMNDFENRVEIIQIQIISISNHVFILRIVFFYVKAICTMTFDGVGWLQIPECFASIQVLKKRILQSILVVVVTQRQRTSLLQYQCTSVQYVYIYWLIYRYVQICVDSCRYVSTYSFIGGDCL